MYRSGLLKTLWLGVVLLTSEAVNAIEPHIALFADAPLRPVMHGATKLPDGTTLMLSLLRPASGYMGQTKVRVASGHFVSERFSANGNPLNPGE